MIQQHGREVYRVAAAVAVLALAGAASTAEAPALELVKTIALKGKAGGLDHLALDAKGGRLFLANSPMNSLDVVDVKSGKLLQSVTGQRGIQGIAYADDLDRVYVGLGTGGFCNVFDGKSYRLLKTVKFKDDADNVRYNRRTHRVYVAHAEKALGVIDARTYKKLADIDLPGDPESFQLEAERPRLYLNTPSESQVAMIDTDENEVVKTFPLKLAGANFAMGLDESSHRLFIGCRKKPMLVVMDSESGKEVAGVDIPGDTDDLYFDVKHKRIYVSCGDGFLAVIRQTDADHYELVDKVATAKGARTCAFDPDSGRIYLAVPRQEGTAGPAIRVYQAKR
jgi:DNA-binding beta-propeller fold protein YncE